MDRRSGRKSHRGIPVRAIRHSHDEGARSAGRPHHQQWIHLRACAAALFGALHAATKHAITGLTRSISLDGRNFNIACGQIDIGNASTEMTARMSGGVPQANGTLAPEPVMDVRHVADAVLYMANLPLDANVEFMTVMATKMPFIGRG